MSISASDVKKVRELTNAAMMTCKKALVECDGDIDKAVEHIQKNSAASAAKKADRQTYEGRIIVASVDSYQALIEVNSETDFVSGSDNFINFCDMIKAIAESVKPSNLEELLSATTENGESLEEARQSLVAKIGENIKVSRINVLNDVAHANHYVHVNGKVASIVSIDADKSDVARDLAMHVVAVSPVCFSIDTMTNDDREKIVDILKAEEVDESLIDSSIKDHVFMTQDYIKDPSLTVEAYLASQSTQITAYGRMEVGENVVREETDFVSEVMAQVRGED